MGRATGDAYVQFTSQSIADRALQKHKEKIGRRYVEIFKSTLTEARTAINAHSHCVGSGFSRPGPYDRMDKRMGSGMGLGYGGGGRGGGMGYGRGNIKGLMSKSNNGMGGGNIKGLMSHNDDDYDDFSYGGGSSYRSGGYGGGGGMGMGGGYGGGRGGGRGGGMGRGGRGRGGMRGGRGGGGGGGDSAFMSKTGHSVHMRGLPYSATENDIQQFFMPINLENVVIGFGEDGRPSGEADVEFANHSDAVQAMRMNNALMERRYIELFLHSDDNSGYSGNSYGGDAAYCDNYTTSSGYGSNYTQF